MHIKKCCHKIENRDSIIAELHYEKERSNKQYLKLEKIKHIMEL